MQVQSVAEKLINSAAARMSATINSRPDGSRTFFDPSEFAWVEKVESRWRQIRQEAADLVGLSQPIPDFPELELSDGGWKSFWFYIYGNKINKACAACPQTAQALKLIPGMRTAFFSIIEPGKRILPHTGPYKGVLRYHLGLDVPRPEPDVGIRVGDEVRGWREGKSLIFDDTHLHEAWNFSDRARTVLFVDFERPLRMPEAALNPVLLAVAKYLHPEVRGIMVGAERYCNAVLRGERSSSLDDDARRLAEAADRLP